MKLTAVSSTALVVLALAACSTLSPQPVPTPTPSSPPAADVKVSGEADRHGSFFMSPGQTLLVELPSAGSQDSTVLAFAGHYPNATLFRAVAVGRTWVIADYPANCPTECNPLAPLQIGVVVVSDQGLKQGVVLSEQDQPLITHLRSGQRFVLTLRNRAGSPAWASLTSANPAVIVPDQPAVVSADGIRRQFRAGELGRTGVWATGPDCPTGTTCPSAPYIDFGFVVFR